MSIARRGLFKMIGGLAALPVAERAATKLAAVDTSTFANLAHAPSLSIGGLSSDQGNWEWVKNRVKEALSDSERARIEEDIKFAALPLDPDLASSRSLSLSAAMRIQRERQIERRLTAQRRYWLREFKQATGTEWLS
jgi:hypothetical protein